MTATSPARSPAFSPARRPTDVSGGGPNYGYLTINDERGTVTVDEGDTVIIEFVAGPAFPVGTMDSWSIAVDGEVYDDAEGDFELNEFTATEDLAGRWTLTIEIAGQTIRVSTTLIVTPLPIAVVGTALIGSSKVG
jgi:hypothetical protein